MTISQLLNKLPLEHLTRSLPQDILFNSVYACDLLSQVLAKAGQNDLWITVQTHGTILGIASIKQIPCILFTEGLRPEQAVIDKAEQEGIFLLASQLTTFQIGGQLYKLLLEEESNINNE